MISIPKLPIRWEAVAGATGYEIRRDGVVIGTKGKLARTVTVNVDDRTLIEVLALPERKPEEVQSVDFGQGP
jgi:hypothetical protein